MPLFRFVLLASLTTGCATAKLVGERAFCPEDPGVERTIVLEPFFELAELQTTTRTQYAQLASSPYGLGGMGMGGFGTSSFPSNNTVAITQTISEKPFFAKANTLVQIHARVIAEVQRRRPSWRVTSTGGSPLLKGEVTILRTIIQGNELVESNRTLKNLAFGFGLVILPLQLVNITPVEETTRVYGILERFGVDANALSTRLVKYPSQPDFAVNLAGVQSTRREFGLDVMYEEGLLADEKPRAGVLIDGFVDRLSAAMVAIVEEQP
ncbi:MAG: hypothetical protein JNM17_40360 [Archangium sp.]|nr:hypothetical protein [Archangium sp.]